MTSVGCPWYVSINSVFENTYVVSAAQNNVLYKTNGKVQSATSFSVLTIDSGAAVTSQTVLRIYYYMYIILIITTTMHKYILLLQYTHTYICTLLYTIYTILLYTIYTIIYTYTYIYVYALHRYRPRSVRMYFIAI